MSFSIDAWVGQQSDPHHWFYIVEKSVRGEGIWTEFKGHHTLTMAWSGTSGMLRFKNDAGEYFLVALGFHSNKRWCAIVPNAKNTDTAGDVLPMFYKDKSGHYGRTDWTDLPYVEKTTARKTKVKVDFCKAEGNNLEAIITITTNSCS